MRIFRTTLLALTTLIAPLALTAQSADDGLPSTDPLYKTVAALDSQLYNAYNSCNLDKLGSMVSEDLEFYHDKTGLAVGRKPFVEAIKNNICGKVHRELVSSTLEVYPMHDYGAVEIGIHRFTHPSNTSKHWRSKVHYSLAA